MTNTAENESANLYCHNCGQPLEKVVQDTERDNFMTAQDALAYGLVDKVLEKQA